MAAMYEDPSQKAQSLPDRMRRLADGGKHPQSVELFARARELDAAIMANRGTPEQTKKMVGCWARARRLWSHLTGEDLI